ncbi:RES family NAD+ phosphorylase [Yoonia vestfoldensis]|uniref:RES family NAD+ phosphorylase n=1 Tax=Yoonia vestfoldensis TaxID=245188 RepID=UPI00037CF697|nr:RES family NAD+ phosphorylase [Yoonia vestfoldensis]
MDLPQGLVPFIAVDMPVYRILLAARSDKVLDGVSHAEGRFHHTGQTAIYAATSPEAAPIAMDIALKRSTAARVIVPLHLTSTRMVDLGNEDLCRALRIDPAWQSAPWAEERSAGRQATTWRVSDAVRKSGADGVIYRLRRAPDKVLIALFGWNRPGRADLRIAGESAAWSPPSRD